MDQEHRHCKPLDSGRAVKPLPAPRLLERLLAGRQVLRGLTADDLREMCKAREITNLSGLAAHRIERPLPPGWDPAIDLKARTDRPDLAEGYYRALSYWLNVHPVICVQGYLAGASESALPVEIYVPLTGAQLAMAAQSMLWPAGEAGEPFEARMRVLCWPEPLTTKNGKELLAGFAGYWPAAGFALTIGHDDPSLIADILWDIAQRAWEDEMDIGRIVEENERLEVTDECRARFVKDENPASAEWLASLDPMLEEKTGACATPLWANPILPAECLSANAPWREAALAVDALPFGVAIDIDGRFPPFENEPIEGWIVVPRAALPAPMARAARQYQLV
ncbi:hypothetical protein LLG95_16110 [bacterium]|nr:hypothetical protein [bacterium]